MIIYITRHGETIWNKKRILQGHKDSPLTLKGINTAKRKGKALSRKGIEIIYSSDLGRCVQTSEIINQWLRVKLIKTPKLRERNFGDLNGQPGKKVKEKLDLSDPNEKAPNGESFNQLKKRIITFIQSLTNKKFRKILLVTHEGPVRAILSEYYQTDFYSKKCDNSKTAIYKLKVLNNRIKKGISKSSWSLRQF